MPFAFVSSVREPVAVPPIFAVRFAGPSVVALMSALFGPARTSYSSGPSGRDTGATTIVAVGATTAAAALTISSAAAIIAMSGLRESERVAFGVVEMIAARRAGP